MPPTLYILYNASASIMGKLTYGYKKLTSSSASTPICAACDITHGGLHLDETAAWKEVKAQIAKEGGGMEVRQLHRDELGEEVKGYVEANRLGYPVVLLKEEGEGKGELRVVMDSQELGDCGGDPEKFATKLRGKGVMPSSG